MNTSDKNTSCRRRARWMAGMAWLAVSLALCEPATAAQKTTMGTDFWLAFLLNYNGEATLSVIVSSDVDASFTVSVPGLGFSQSSNVTAGASATIVVPSSAMLTSADGNAYRGVHVTADQPISVYAMNQSPGTADGTVVLPTETGGTSYFVMSHVGPPAAGWAGSEFGIVAAEDNTTVMITLTAAVGGHIPEYQYLVILNRGEAYQLRSTVVGSLIDLSGTFIVSDKPVAVFGGTVLASSPSGGDTADHLFHQIPPLTTWGHRYFLVPLGGRTNGDTVRILASEDTVVLVNGTGGVSIHQGQLSEQILTNASEVVSTKPILVMQLANSFSHDGLTGDPFMMLIPPYEQFLTNYCVATPASGFASNYVNLVAPSSVLSRVTMDGVPVNPAIFKSIGDTAFVGGSLSIEPGAHRFEAPLPIGVCLYGFNEYDSFGYAGGMALSPVATVKSLVMTPETATNNAGQPVTLSARLLDSSDEPVPGVRLDVEVTGANPSAGFGVTDTNGYARYTYPGTVAGQDTVVASVGFLTGQSIMTWTAARAIAEVSKWMEIKAVKSRLDPGTGALMVDFRLKYLSGGPKPDLRAPFRLALSKTANWSLQRKDGKTGEGTPYTDLTTQVKAKLLAKYGRKVMRPGDSIVVTVGIFSRKNSIPPIDGFYAF